MLGMIDDWDPLFNARGDATSAAHGVAIANGDGSNAPNRAKVLKMLGYEVALFLDHDVPEQMPAVDAAIAAGVQVFRWTKGRATEDELVQTLDATGLTELLQFATTVRGDEATVRSDLLNRKQPVQQVPDLDVVQWIACSHFTLDSARALISLTARKQSWFKNVDNGRALSGWVQNQAQLQKSPFLETIIKVGQFIYAPDKPGEPAPAPTPTPSPAGAGA